MVAPYPIDVTIPQVNNDPANDCPLMQTNFANIKGYLTVDHVEPGSVNAGWHEQVTYNEFVTPSAPSGETGIAYVDAGVAEPSVPQNYFINSRGIMPLSAIKGVGVFTWPAVDGVITKENAYNVVTITRTSSVTFEVDFVANTFSTVNVIPFIIVYGTSNPYTYSFSGQKLTVTLQGSNFGVGRKIVFSVMQI